MPRVTAFGGIEEIGGNRVLVETDARIFLDFGTSYKNQGLFFHEYLKPRKVSGLSDYFRMGLAPDLRGVYREDLLRQMGRPPEPKSVDAVVLSHPHLDHAGLFPLLRPDIPLVMSPASRAILRTLQDTGNASQPIDYLTYEQQFGLRDAKTGPPRKLKAEGAARTRVERVVQSEASVEFGKTKVVTWTVDHSIPGSRGTIVESPDLTLAYTGDLRLHGRRREDTQRFLKRAAGVDVLVTEGTNLEPETPLVGKEEEDSPTKFMPEGEVAKTLAETIGQAEGFCFVNYPNRDVDRFYSFYEAARRTSRRLLLTTKQAHMFDLLRKEGLEVPSLEDRNLGVYLPRRGYGYVDRPELAQAHPNVLKEDYQRFEQPFLDQKFTFSPADVRREPHGFLVYVDYYNMTELIDLDPSKGTYVFSKTEPFDDEMELDHLRLRRWLDHFHLRLQKAHASGHAPPDDLWFAIDAIGADRILPIHTLNVRAFEDRYRGKVERVALGKAVTV